MRDILRKEFRLSASPLAYCFIAFGLMFLVPGYPILCGAFFVTLGLFHSFQAAREANDITFSALLPIAKRDVVRGKYLFVLAIEVCGFALMAAATVIRMTALVDAPVYRQNALMNANPFALGAALLIYGLFNRIFVGGFFRTAYRLGRPFLLYIIVGVVAIMIAEALHHIGGLESLNAFGTAHIGLQLALFSAGLAAFALITLCAYNRACRDFERTDL